jgi:hypothetical protein
VNPRWQARLAALKEFVPANQRETIPFDGLERLQYWRAHREATKTRLSVSTNSRSQWRT